MLQASPAPAPGGPPRRRATSGLLRLAGPGAIVAVAYVDPGNVATNVEAGARFGPALLWVVGLAALAGMLVQHLAAKRPSAPSRSCSWRREPASGGTSTGYTPCRLTPPSRRNHHLSETGSAL